MYNRQVKKVYTEAGIFKIKHALAKKATWFANGSSGMSHKEFLSTFSQKFNTFHLKTQQIREKVADKMRKIHAGGQDFSSQSQVYWDTIESWKRILNPKQGVLKSRAVLQALAKCLKFSLQIPKRLTYETVQRKLTMAYKTYFYARPNLSKWRE